MANNQVAAQLECAKLQMAAEALFGIERRGRYGMTESSGGNSIAANDCNVRCVA